MTPPAEPALELEDVRKRFPGGAGLDGISLALAPGRVLVLLGTSGSGKTTALKTINRLVEPDSGRISVLGRDVAAWDPIALRRGIGYVIQESGLLPHMTVGDNVALVPRLLGWPEEKRRARARELLNLVGLDPDRFMPLLPARLSGGERQRAGIARALGADPPLLLMDEPFGALDEMTRERMNLELLRIWDASGSTIVFVTHSIPEAVFLSTRVVVMSARPGRVAGIVEIDLPQPRTARTREEPRFFELVTEVRERLAAGGADVLHAEAEAL